MYSRNWNVGNLIEKKQWEFLDAYTIRSNIRKGVAGPKILLDSLSTYSKKLSKEIWSILDTFSYYILNYENKEIMEIVDDIIANAREHGGSHFLLVVEGMLEDQIITHLAHLTDGLFRFNLDETQSDAIGVIRIDKLRKVDYVTRIIPYRITETGLTIETWFVLHS